MKQKRQAAGMIQASDVRNISKSRNNSGSRRELHGN